MVALMRASALDFGGELPDEARQAIRDLLATEPGATRKVYAALARKIWSLLIERRFDAEIRDWHALLTGVKVQIREADAAASERVTALADLLRESISLAETSPARAVAERPRARRILEMLQEESGFVARRVLKEGLEMGTSHLSNVMTQLVAHNLVDRRDKGKEAEFRITALGRQMLGGDAPVDHVAAIPVLPHIDTEMLAERLKHVSIEAVGSFALGASYGLVPLVHSRLPDHGPLDLSDARLTGGQLARGHDMAIFLPPPTRSHRFSVAR